MYTYTRYIYTKCVCVYIHTKLYMHASIHTKYMRIHKAYTVNTHADYKKYSD